MSNPTANALTEFDLCLALAQPAINSQLHYAWAAWKRRKAFSDTISIMKIKRDGQLVDSKYGLRDLVVAPLTVSLNVPSGKLGQVSVTMPLTSGVVDFYDEAQDQPSSFSFGKQDGWSVSFIVDLDKAPIDLTALAAIDPDSHQTAVSVIKASGLPDAVFSIEYLFMDLTKVDLLLDSDRNVSIPASVPDSARTKALSCLNLLLQGDLGKFMLGTVVRRNNLQAVPTFALTDFIFDVHADAASPLANTLSYLGMLANRPLPADINAARLRLTDGWLSPGMVDGSHGLVSGIMAIGKSVFMDKYLIAGLTRLIGRSPNESGLSWGYGGGSTDRWNSSDIINREWEKGVQWQLQLAAVPGSNRIDIGGRVSSHAYMDGYTMGANIHSEGIHMEGYQDLSGSIALVANGIGTDFNIKPTLTYKFGEPVVTKDDVDGGAKVLTVFQKAFTGSTTAEKLHNLQADLINQISGWLNRVLSNFSVNLTQHVFIPPGGGVFTFQNARFSPAGDLTFDVIYQAP
ncbi:hypothetical protein JQ625_31805 [Bradyrhizobium diazoefficiens]|nr:hypothetical protein [Bradyrhizobium diazoefficiens]MBR0779428.1 hypothetical protein [Bradyrhizobium diazoefficiens]